MHPLRWLASASVLLASLVGAIQLRPHLSPAPADVHVHDEFHVQVESPNLADRITRKIILANGLKAFLVSDPGLVKAGAALSVETGNWRDPKGVQGLAHFTEHMLFMGSKEFPAEGEFDRYSLTGVKD
jgi:secreted Zn-dependent insulinase-like peptidase